MLTQIDAEIQKTLEDLRDLARGIYPPLLVDKGLGAALDAQARRSLVPTTVKADTIGRYPPELEAAVYFSCLEALQNVAKYADASSATVTLTQSNGHLTFEVADDGSGFDPEAVRFGHRVAGDRRPSLGAPRRAHDPLRARSRHARSRADRGGRVRRAFRIVAGVLGVAVIGLSLPFAITSFTDDAESIHRLHFVAGVFASGLLLGDPCSSAPGGPSRSGPSGLPWPPALRARSPD